MVKVPRIKSRKYRRGIEHGINSTIYEFQIFNRIYTAALWQTQMSI